MKIMGRSFKRSEKILLIALAIILVGLLYYKFVYVNIEETTTKANAEAATLQTELDISQAQLMSMKKMQNELDDVMSDPNASRVESYNNSVNERAFLNDILDKAIQYSVSFGDVTRNGDLIRRNFTLKYQADSYSDATDIMEELGNSKYRCLISDLACSIDDENKVTISCTATFYETMVGGTPDSGLPKDETKTVEPVVTE